MSTQRQSCERHLVLGGLILALRWEAWTYAEIGRHLQLSAGRVAQIDRHFHRLMCHPSRKALRHQLRMDVLDP